MYVYLFIFNMFPSKIEVLYVILHVIICLLIAHFCYKVQKYATFFKTTNKNAKKFQKHTKKHQFNSFLACFLQIY